MKRWPSLVVVLVLFGAGAWAALSLRLDSDLARFMPAPHSADERLLIGEISRGPASRLLMLAIGGSDADTVIRASRGLRAALADDDAFEHVLNGEVDEAQVLAAVLPLRFSHSPAMASARFDAEGLAETLHERLADLGSLGGDTFDTVLAHDPHLLTLAMLEAWQPARMPPERDGVWFSPQGEALLIAQTKAAGFDPQAQALALQRVQQRFSEWPDAEQLHLEIAGAGSFSARMGERVRGEATWLAAIASAGLIVLLLLAYRSPLFVLASALPMLSAVAAGLLALRLGFDSVHGITLAFACTLIGVALDYPVHLLSHSHPGEPMRQTARALWPALRLAVLSTVVAYLSLFSAQAEGLAQLAAFTIAGLLAAALVSRYVLPRLLPQARRDVLESRRFSAFASRLLRLRGSVLAVVTVLLLAGTALIVQPNKPWWNLDLAALTPLPADWLMQEQRLREALGTPDGRHLLVLSGVDTEAVLQLSERLQPRLDALIGDGVLADHGLPSRWQPSEQVQRWRLARLPAAEPLRAALADAADASGFDAAFFEPMVADVRLVRSPEGVTALAEAFAASPAGARVQTSLRESDTGAHALVELTAIADLTALAAAIDGEPGARVLDLKQAAEAMVAAYRERVLLGLAIAAGVLALLLAVLLGPRRMLRVLPPILLAVIATLALLRLLGVELGLFHLIALMLAAGLGMDFAVFFDHAESGPEQARTLHAVMISVASTLLVFGLLAASSIPVLRAIGGTVAIGVACQFLLALAMTRHGRA